MNAEQIQDIAYYELIGADSIRFLNNYCTADLKRWDQNRPIEAMLLDVKGRLIALVTVLPIENGLGLLCWGKPVVDLMPHLDRYIFGNDKSIQTVEASLYFLPESDAPLVTQGEDFERSAIVLDVEEIQKDCRRLKTILPGQFYLFTGQSDLESRQRVMGAEVEINSAPVFHRMRIANAYPFVQQDTEEASLVQELQRDDIAISFTKGCYLGQETVARLDARGHVNWLLTRVALANPLPESLVTDSRINGDIEVVLDGSVVGKLTSVSENWGLARIRSTAAKQKAANLEIRHNQQTLTTARLI